MVGTRKNLIKIFMQQCIGFAAWGSSLQQHRKPKKLTYYDFLSEGERHSHSLMFSSAAFSLRSPFSAVISVQQGPFCLS